MPSLHNSKSLYADSFFQWLRPRDTFVKEFMHEMFISRHPNLSYVLNENILNQTSIAVIKI